MLDQLTLFRVGIGLAYGDHLLLAEEHRSPLKSALVNARVVTISSKIAPRTEDGSKRRTQWQTKSIIHHHWPQ